MSIFPTKILLATDGSEDAELALDMAVSLADATGSELHLITVARPYPSGSEALGFPEQLERTLDEIQREAEQTLEEQVKKVEEAGGAVSDSEVRLLSPGVGVITYAEDIEASLIVMGSRGRAGIKRALLGSTSESVVRHAHCPVVVVRRGERIEEELFGGKVLVAADGSEESDLALRTGVELTQATGAQLHLAYVLPAERSLPFSYPFSESPDESALLPADKAVFEKAKQEGQRFLDEQVDRTSTYGGTVADTHFVVGKPDAEIVRISEELGVGLVVVGSRGRGALRRALMGSVSDSVVRHAHCPVMVVREERPQVPADTHQTEGEQE